MIGRVNQIMENKSQIEANNATVKAKKIACASLGVAIIALIVAILTLCVAYRSLILGFSAFELNQEKNMIDIQDKIEDNSSKIEDFQSEVQKLRSGMTPIWFVAGARQNEGKYANQIEFEPGKDISVQIIFRNTVGEFANIYTKITLPEYLEYVLEPEPPKLNNTIHPTTGKELDVTQDWIALGRYPFYEADTGLGEGVVRFKVRMREDKDFSGAGMINMLVQMTGYQDDLLVTYIVYQYVRIKVSAN